MAQSRGVSAYMSLRQDLEALDRIEEACTQQTLFAACVTSPTLNQVLARLGYTTRPADSMAGVLGAKDVLLTDGSVALSSARAHEVWDWLRDNGQHV